ncbi:MAG: alpha/beta hydrolase [Halioglobus sp.]|nr:alpha/beta hydrolase [Halioglobus sp.]
MHRLAQWLPCLLFFTLSWSALGQVQEPALEPLPTLPAHWRTHSISETIFGGTVFVAEAGQQGRPVVILVHGLGQAGLADWLTVVPALERDYHVIALDLPGFGRSDSPRGKYSPANYAAVVHQVKERFSRGPVHVVGHSMGGAVTLRYSSDYPHHVSSAVLVDAAGILNRTAFVKHSAGAVIDAREMPIVLDGLRGVLARYAGAVLETVGRWPDPTGALGEFELLWGSLLVDNSNVNAALALVNEDFTNAVLRNATPVQVIWGSDDAVTPLRTGTLLAGRLPNAQLHVIEGAGHIPMKSHTATFNRLLLGALANPPARPVTQKQHHGSLKLSGKRGGTYTGAYDLVEIRDSRELKLANLSAGQLVIIDSIVELENVDIDAGENLAALVERSRILGTNVSLRGAQGMIISQSNLDIAGLDIKAQGTGVEVVYPSQGIFSIGRIESGREQRNVHGQFSMNIGVMETALP